MRETRKRKVQVSHYHPILAVIAALVCIIQTIQTGISFIEGNWPWFAFRLVMVLSLLFTAVYWSRKS